MDPIIAEIEREYMRDDLPAFAPGDTVRVRVRVVEGQKERIQIFEGICIAKQGGRLSETFTVRRISGGVGVERTFPLHSPTIAGLEVTRRGQVRRAKLYYLRERRGKRARVRERRWWLDAAREAEAVQAGPEGADVVAPEDSRAAPEEAEGAAPEGTPSTEPAGEVKAPESVAEAEETKVEAEAKAAAE